MHHCMMHSQSLTLPPYTTLPSADPFPGAGQHPLITEPLNSWKYEVCALEAHADAHATARTTAHRMATMQLSL